jgi:hypothetical protein
MNNWKIKNITNQPIKVSVITSNITSKGLILEPGQVCLASPSNTASLDAQVRRGFLSVDETFDNSTLNLELGVAMDESKTLTKLQEAEKDASEYINKQPN